MSDGIFTQARSYIRNGKLDNAISVLLENFDSLHCNTFNVKSHQNELISISSRLSTVNDEIAKDIIKNEDKSNALAKITNALLLFINKLEDELIETSDSLSSTYTSKETDESEQTFIEIVIDRDFNTFSIKDQNKILKAIGVLIDMERGDIKIIRKKPGSVKLTLSIPKNKARLLQKLISNGELSKLDIENSKIINKKNILIIEEDKKVEKLISDLLSFESTVYSIQNSKNINSFFKNKKTINLIILVLKDKKQNTIDFLRSIRLQELATKIPLIIISSVFDESFISESFKLGIRDFIVKPLHPKTLLDKIDLLLSNIALNSNANDNLIKNLKKEILIIGFDGQFPKIVNQSNNNSDLALFSFKEINNDIQAYNWLLRKCKSNSEHANNVNMPYAIIMDLNFLVNSNYSLLNNTKKHNILRNIPFIALANDKKDIDSLFLLKKGVDDCFCEPVNWHNLIQRIVFLRRFKADFIDYNTVDEDNQFHIPLVKRIFDIIFASAVLLALSPILLIIAFLVRFSSKGPIVYRSKRVGSGYQVFDFLKFRSMVVEAETKREVLTNLNHYQNDERDGVSKPINLNNDPRITKIGKFIRKTSLDELPQLFNVLKGDMSIVGNRPLPLYEAEQMTRDKWAERFLAPAGITGLWHIHKEKNLTVEERIGLDIEYVNNYSFLFDFKILSKTIPNMLNIETTTPPFNNNE